MNEEIKNVRVAILKDTKINITNMFEVA